MRVSRFCFQGADLEHTSHNGCHGHGGCLGAQTQGSNPPEPGRRIIAENVQLTFRKSALRTNNNNDPACRANTFCIGVTLIAIGIAHDNQCTCKIERIHRRGSIDHRQKRIAGLRHGGNGL